MKINVICTVVYEMMVYGLQFVVYGLCGVYITYQRDGQYVAYLQFLTINTITEWHWQME